MPDQQLQELQAELETLRRKVAAYGTARRPGPPHRGPARGRGRLVATIALTLLVALVPLSMLAAGAFTDLDPASPHNANIEAIRQAGITKGCDPPDFTLYCPNDYVTRQEMASFLARTAGLGDNPPVANAQTAATVVDGAITPAKLSATGSTGGQVLTSTGAGVAWQNPPPAGVSYARTVIVGPVGSNADNGTALLNALAGINASADTPHLLKIEPGIYDLGATPLAMKPYVDIEGSGEGVTTITGNTATSNQVSTGTILGANNAELRFLTVANASVAQGLHTAAIYINGTSPHLTHITVRNSTNQGFVKHGITITGSQAKPLIQGVSISVITGGGGTEGIDISGAAAPTILGVTIEVSGGSSYGILVSGSGSATVRGSIISGGTHAIRVSNAIVRVDASRLRGGTAALQVIDATSRVATSLLDGAATISTSGAVTVACAFTYNANFAALNTSCN